MTAPTSRHGAAAFLTTACLVACGPALAAEPAQKPYAGEQRRAIKSLSADETSALLAGQGSGLAKAAELNGYPGPAHVLELADELRLDAGQRAATASLLAEHKRRARQMGAELVGAEAELDALFAHRRASAEAIDAATAGVAALRGRLRAEHLRTHVLETALLSPEQIERYADLRGYRADTGYETAPMRGQDKQSHDAQSHDTQGHETQGHETQGHETQGHDGCPTRRRWKVRIS